MILGFQLRNGFNGHHIPTAFLASKMQKLVFTKTEKLSSIWETRRHEAYKTFIIIEESLEQQNMWTATAQVGKRMRYSTCKLTINWNRIQIWSKSYTSVRISKIEDLLFERVVEEQKLREDENLKTSFTRKCYAPAYQWWEMSFWIYTHGFMRAQELQK